MGKSRKAATALLLVLAFLVPSISFASAVTCSCVLYLKSLGVAIKGDASVQIPNTPLYNVSPGDVVILQYRKVSHVAYVQDTAGEAFTGLSLVIKEANFHRCQIGTRIIALNDPHIKGIMRTIPNYSLMNISYLS